MKNPFAFTPLPVTVITTLVYTVLITALLVVHHVVPSTPESATPAKGVNLTEAWRDLKVFTDGFRPYNSRRNDEVRDWLLRRIEAILHGNKIPFSKPTQTSNENRYAWKNQTDPPPVVVFSDMVSNLTFSTSSANQSVYFEGTNILVYIRGSDEDERQDDWWNPHKYSRASQMYTGRGGVLVNAHYDSVSTGYGATDDGMGVMTVLQLISHFTTPGNRPKRGILALLNNGEEDYLNGARAFMRHPMSQFPHTFLNLEGAGAGGRATLFRSTDTEVTKFYKNSGHPFGTVISGDGFKRGLIRSQTDYVVFNGELGLRGLDVAFMEPRARYHTTQDSTRYASIKSLWHMLSASLATVQGLSSDTSSTFDGQTDAEGKIDSGHGTEAVWFDLFGRGLALFQLHTLFAISVTLLVVTPIILIALAVILSRVDKWYLFARKKYIHSAGDDEAVQLDGWRGFFRFPIVFVLSSAAVIGLAFLLTKVNPYIVYSSEYAVWSTMLTAWLALTWFFFRGADFMRPSALHRTYSLIWLYILAYVVLIAVTISENNLHIAGGYFMVFYFAAVFAALLLSYIELFALPKKSLHIQIVAHTDTHEDSYPTATSATSSRPVVTSTDDHPNAPASLDDVDDEATETTSLLRGDRQTTFARYGSRRHSGDDAMLDNEEEGHVHSTPQPYGDEQPWSAHLPRWTWLPQFLLLAPIPLILVGQISLLLTSALHQTPADGSPVLNIYIFIATLSVLLMAPLGPFVHRFTFHIPTFLFLVCVGTLIYNLIAFPFSAENRLKVYFVQQVDLDTGINRVSLTGLDQYVQKIIQEIPSAAGQELDCTLPEYAARAGLTTCSWNGLAPKTVKNLPEDVPPYKGYGDWLSFNMSRIENKSEAVFSVVGRNTRACRLYFDSPVTDLHVQGGAEDKRFKRVGDHGTKELRLWSREWERTWVVNVTWDGGEEGRGLDGRVVCLWSDANESGVIPALDEIRRFMPTWAVVSKLSDGLVEGSEAFHA